MSCNIGSINQVHKRLNDNGYFISLRMLRKMAADGILPYVKSGNKMLVNYDTVVELLLARTAVPSHS